MLKVVFDTNVWISAFLFGGLPKKAIDLAREKCQVFCSIFILDEMRKVLAEDFSVPQEKIEILTQEIIDSAEIVPVIGRVVKISRDPKDNPILSTALEAKADFLVTGDHHILGLKKSGKLKIVNPRRFLEIIFRG